MDGVSRDHGRLRLPLGAQGLLAVLDGVLPSGLMSRTVPEGAEVPDRQHTALNQERVEPKAAIET